MIRSDYSETRLEMMKFDNAILLCTDFGDIDWLLVILRRITSIKVTRDIIYIAYPDHLTAPVIDFIDVTFIPVLLPKLDPLPTVGKVHPTIYSAQLLRLVALDEIHKLNMANKVLYMDNDILLFDDIGLLFNQCNAPISAVHVIDAGNQPTRLASDYYFSGVMLIDVKNFYCTIGIDSLMNEFYRVYTPTRFVYSDEEFLNTLIKAEKLPRFYNYQVQFNKRFDTRTIAMHFAWHKPKKQNLYYYVEYKVPLIKLLSLIEPTSKIYNDVMELLDAIDNHRLVFGVSHI